MLQKKLRHGAFFILPAHRIRTELYGNLKSETVNK